MSSIVKAIAIYKIVQNRKKNARQRRFWVHPVVADRPITGAFVTLFGKLRADEKKFFNYFRMSERSFNELLAKVEDQLKHQDVVRISICRTERLAVTLRYLASGNTMTDLHYSYLIGISALSTIVGEVCNVIWTIMRGECMPQPSTEMWGKISEGFNTVANYPNCIGALDVKRIRLEKPTQSGSLFFNYKSYFSIVLMALCDANYCFTFVDVGAYGGNCDSNVFTNSELWRKLEAGQLGIPEPRPLPGTKQPRLPFVIIADEGFGLSQNVMRPYARKNLTYKKNIFNYRLTRGRRLIECTFGILSNKWRIFHRPLNIDIDKAKLIVKACCVLHNFVRARDSVAFEDTLSINGLQDFEGQAITDRSADSIREKFADYFVGVGAVSWQDSKI